MDNNAFTADLGDTPELRRSVAEAGQGVCRTID